MPTLPSSPPPGGPELGADTMDLLRFATIGSVDDGKSTLIGRLLFDTRQLFDDQLDALSVAAERRGMDEVDLSFVTDGLRAEREQGITIDVAYRYAATPHRKFVIADCPGHVQYTRNMATGAVDGRPGPGPGRRHRRPAGAVPAAHLHRRPARRGPARGLRQQDGPGRLGQVGLPAHRRRDADAVPAAWASGSCTVIPISALHGDNVVERSDAAPWYDGPTVLDALESAQAGGWASQHGLRQGNGGRLPVQWVLRQPGGGRSYAGMVNGGPFRNGDPVIVLPQGHVHHRAHHRDGRRPAAPGRGRPVGLSAADRRHRRLAGRPHLLARGAADGDRHLRGDRVLVPRPPAGGRRPPPCSSTPPGSRRPWSSGSRASSTSTPWRCPRPTSWRENDIGVVHLRTAMPLALDAYRVDRITGSFVLIDELTMATVAAGMVGPPSLHS